MRSTCNSGWQYLRSIYHHDDRGILPPLVRQQARQGSPHYNSSFVYAHCCFLVAYESQQPDADLTFDIESQSLEELQWVRICWR